jgi:competence protein ComEC
MRTRHLMTAVVGLAALVASGSGCAIAQTKTTLDIYVVDVEGGNATLFVAPSGESVLIDTGNFAPDAAKRDADRIMAAAKDARLAQIDHLITTHWHGDHFGGMAEVANRIPIREYIDHGPNIQPVEAFGEFFAKTYPALCSKAKHTVAKPGDTVSVGGLDWRIVSAADRCLRRRSLVPVPQIHLARASSSSRSTPPRTHSRSAASSPSASSGWRISAI